MVQDIQAWLAIVSVVLMLVGAFFSGPLWFPLLKLVYLKLLELQASGTLRKANKYQKKFPGIMEELDKSRNYFKISFLESSLSYMRTQSRVLQNIMNANRRGQGIYEVRFIDENFLLIPEAIVAHRIDMMEWLRQAEEDSEPKSLHRFGFILLAVGSILQIGALIPARWFGG